MTSVSSRRGVVVDFDEHVGLGTIRDESFRFSEPSSEPGSELSANPGEEFFFHCTEIADGSRCIDVGAEVTFVVAPAHKGLYQATAVTSTSAISS